MIPYTVQCSVTGVNDGQPFDEVVELATDTSYDAVGDVVLAVLVAQKHKTNLNAVTVHSARRARVR